MRLSGYQPQYFPRLHYFARILDSDIFTISDYLQYVRKHAAIQKDNSVSRVYSHQAHMPIKSGTGVLFLDIPVKKGGIEGRQALDEAQIDYSSAWQQKTIKTIHTNYIRAPYYDIIFPSLAILLAQRYSTLAEYTIASTLWALGVLFEVHTDRPKGPSIAAINERLPMSPFRLTRIVRMSETDIPPADKDTRDANDWLIETCKKFGADEYCYGGTAATAYMDFEKFKQAGIQLVEQKWACMQYPQRHKEFIPNLSIVDLLMNVSPEEARRVLATPQ